MWMQLLWEGIKPSWWFSDMHSWLVDYMFAICLTKWLSWLRLVRSSPWSSFVLEALSLSHLLCLIKFLVVISRLDLKRWHTFHGYRIKIEKLGLQSHGCTVMPMPRGLQLHGCSVIPVINSLGQWKRNLTQGLGTWVVV